MTKDEIYLSITNFLTLFEQDFASGDDLEQNLVKALDTLALAYHFADYPFDEADYPEPPTIDYQSLYELIGEKFPHYGYYNVPEQITTKIAETNISVGDAIDDIVDIIMEIQEIKWRWENTSELDALWHFRLTYKMHWETHLRDLQRYILAQYLEATSTTQGS